MEKIWRHSYIMSFKLILKSSRSKEIQEIKITSHFRILPDFFLYLLSEVDIFLLISENHLQGPGKQCPFSSLNLLHLNMSRYILHTVLYTFLKVLRRRVCPTMKRFLSWWWFLYSCDLTLWLKGDNVRKD